MSENAYRLLNQRLGYTFNDQRLLELALSHRSVRGQSNERLEFLGDSLLNFIIAHALYEQLPQASEGELSRLRASLVNGETLAEIARDFDLGHFLRLGSGELKSGGARRGSILADAIEAIIAAIYIDGGMDRCQSRVLAWYTARLEFVLSANILKDSKTRLQEFLQSRRLALPNYNVREVIGEAHAQTFHVECFVEGLSFSTEGYGPSRRRAEQEAAEKYLSLLLANN